ncbi:MAG: TIGR03862 family flavoprotein [Acidimicrobiales bacterium]
MTSAPTVAVIGGGPGGLIAAERLASAGLSVTVYEHMPSVGRKFLLAGRGGLNITHSEPLERLMERYGAAAPALAGAIARFDPAALRAWVSGLGEETFVGSSGRVFPQSFRATPLLRAWLDRLRGLGVEILTRHRWTGFADAATGLALTFVVDGADDAVVVTPDAVVLALGGASWPKVGSDAAWVPLLESRGVSVATLRPANCGFVAEWTDVFRERFAGVPLKNVSLSIDGATARGEAMITETGLEGGVVYAIGATIRDRIEADGAAVVRVDLQPDMDVERLTERLRRRRPKESATSALRKGAGLSAPAVALLREATGNQLPSEPAELAALIGSVPVRLVGCEPVERAISTAGGVGLDEIDSSMMLRRCPGVFVAGEMLDWEAPTGGYLLQATFSTGVAAADGVLAWLEADRPTG